MRLLLLLPLIVLFALAAGCSEEDDAPNARVPEQTQTEMSSAETSSTDALAAPSRMTVTMGAPNEFAMVPAVREVAAGAVVLDVVNEGTIEHEVVIIRTDLDSGALPTTPDGAAVEDGAVIPHGEEHEGAEGHHAGVHFHAAQGGPVTLNLEPGSYAVVCNLPGHYAAGMHANLRVL